MFSKRVSRLMATMTLVAACLVIDSALDAQARLTPKFYPDDPLMIDDDTAFDAGAVKEIELSEVFDFLENSFGSPGDRSDIRAVNVNTMDEVPDSSWFTNRIGVREMSAQELARGPNKFERLDAEKWIVVSGKGPGGFHPGFRAVHPNDPKQIYQLEVDPPGYPQLASGAELIGTLVYHALGYNVVDSYVTRVHPSNISIAESATTRDASGRRKFTQGDLDAVLRVAARDTQGRVYISASRFEEGKNIGHFQYHGTRSDDPNDIYPHEHRRELRANRVFAAWLAHDDSRAVNSLNMLVEENGRRFVRHYMYDFGATLGSATRFPDTVYSGQEHYLEQNSSLKALLSLGFIIPGYLRVNYPDAPPSAGFFHSVAFDPTRWAGNYPNTAFDNMRADDAFWGARLVSRFTDAHIRTIVEQVGYDDPRATEYLTRTLIERRDAITRVWLNGVNPVVDVSLASDGTLTFANAALQARAASPGRGYRVRWTRFDNDSGVHQPIGEEMSITEPRATPPSPLPTGAAYVAVTIRGDHPEHPAWRLPVEVYFRRTGDGWKTVGLFRSLAEQAKPGSADGNRR